MSVVPLQDNAASQREEKDLPEAASFLGAYEPPQGPRHSPTVGSQGGAVSYERGTPVVGSEKRTRKTFPKQGP